MTKAYQFKNSCSQVASKVPIFINFLSFCWDDFSEKTRSRAQDIRCTTSRDNKAGRKRASLGPTHQKHQEFGMSRFVLGVSSPGAFSILLHPSPCLLKPSPVPSPVPSCAFLCLSPVCLVSGAVPLRVPHTVYRTVPRRRRSFSVKAPEAPEASPAGGSMS